MPVDQDTLQQLVFEAASKSSLVKVATDEIVARTEAMRQDQLMIADKLEHSADNNALIDYSGDRLRTRALDYVEFELRNYALFDGIAARAEVPVLPQIRSHRMRLMLGVFQNELLHSPEADNLISQLAHGKFHTDDSFEDRIPLLRTGSYWGSNAGVLQSTRLLATRFAFSGEDITNYYPTSVAHAALCDPLFKPTFDLLSQSKSQFLVRLRGNNPQDTLDCFGFVHGGYAFGGSRGEVELPLVTDAPKQFLPDDCSSIVNKWLDRSGITCNRRLSSTLTTAAMLYHWRSRRETSQQSVFVDPATYTPAVSRLYSSLTAVEPNQNRSCVSGDIFLQQYFNTTNKIDSAAPTKGHTGVVLGKNIDDPTEALVIECARNMEIENPAAGVYGCAGLGVGIHSTESRETFPDAIRTTMFLRPKRA
jgi:hypothetical protein